MWSTVWSTVQCTSQRATDCTALRRRLRHVLLLPLLGKERLQHLHDVPVIEARVAHVAHHRPREALRRARHGTPQPQPRLRVGVGVLVAVSVVELGEACSRVAPAFAGAAGLLDSEAQVVEGGGLLCSRAARGLQRVQHLDDLDELVKLDRARAVSIDLRGGSGGVGDFGRTSQPHSSPSLGRLWPSRTSRVPECIAQAASAGRSLEGRPQEARVWPYQDGALLFQQAARPLRRAAPPWPR